MTVEQTCEYLLSKNRHFDRNIIHDKDKHGRDFCEMIIPNEKRPFFPITVTVTELGCSVAAGQISDVTGSERMTPDQALTAIDDITSDRIIFVLGYGNDDDIGSGSPFFSRIFALTGNSDDMSAEYEKFIKKLETPINKRLRFLTSLKGRFVISSFSGTVNKTIIR